MAKKTEQKAVLGKVLGYVRRYWTALIISLLLALVYVAMSLYIPILVGQAVDHIIEAGRVDFAAVGMYLMRIAVCAAFAGVSQWVMNELNNRIIKPQPSDRCKVHHASE